MTAMSFYTDRLWIRPIEAGDWYASQMIIKDFNRSKYRIYDMPLPESDTQVRDMTTQWAQSGLFFGIFLADTSEMIGYICFHRDNSIYDLGYCFHTAHHGKGYAYEGCAALMDEMTSCYPIRCFTASTALENEPSCRLLEKLGFTLRGTECISFHKDAYGNDIPFTSGNFIKNLRL